MNLNNSVKIRVGIMGPCPPPHGGVTRLLMNNLRYWKPADIEAFFIPKRVPSSPEPPEGAIFIDHRDIYGRLSIPLSKIGKFIKFFPLTKGKNYLDFYNYNCALAKLISDLKINILYAHHTHAIGLSALLQSHIYGIPSVITSYGETWLVSDVDRRFKRMTEFVLKEASWVISTSEHCRNGALRLGADSERSSVVYAGIDLEKFRPGLDPNLYRDKIGIPAESIVISNLGLSLRQKIDTFLEAIQLLRDYKNIVFLIGGVGDDFDYLQNKVKELDMDNVKLLGFVQENDLHLFYAATDILVASPKTLTECMGQSIKEAMACATPPVVANIGGGPEAISHMETGLLFEPGNSKDLVKALKSLIEDPLLRKRLGDKAVLTARERFDAVKCADEVLNIFNHLLNKKSYAQKGN